ncbi:serine/threonine-protein kinase VRK1 [Amyelois transitella]|uniref:serine/threonine-protein kinase VRK1 n=1 Tax=Amyelois transitella TaxID=680683 RepID=UPI002990157A|nr:serine/threonine-protein kinase VRK1 [Amyelois transitella]
MTGRAKKAAAPKKKANGYKMPAPIAVGEVINDPIGKKAWRIGPSIGVGGFGEIYSACENSSSPKKGSNYPFVVKIEPHENGPLFVEKHFYVRNANKDDISKFMQLKKLRSLGMPTYHGNGSHVYKGEKYRYLVLERYGKDVWSLFKDCGRLFPPATVFQLGLQMLDVLEYIHSRGYVHADIKGANILMGLQKGKENQAFLVDFGLATRVSDKEFKPDPKCAHNGTIEYTSRDAHLGVPTMRGDLEILGYNMLQWLVGELPWEKNLKVPKTVQDMKEAFMKNVRSNVTKQYSSVPDELVKFFEYINTLKPKDTPDYTKCRQMFESYLKKQGVTINSKINFTPGKAKTAKSVKNVISVESDKELDSSEEKIVKKKKPNGVLPKAQRGRKPKIESSIEQNDDGNSDNDKDSDYEALSTKKQKQNGTAKIVKKGRKPKVVTNEDAKNRDNDEVDDSGKSDDDNDSDYEALSSKKQKQNVKVRRGRKPKIVESSPEIDNCENEEPDTEDSIDTKKSPGRNNKRRSNEPAVVVRVKKAKLTPKATPPAKKNHANIATQTSTDKRRSPRQVSFDSPICEIIGEKKPFNAKDNGSADSSVDIFEDSFETEQKKVKPRRKLLSQQEVTVKKVVKKTVTSTKPKGKLKSP